MRICVDPFLPFVMSETNFCPQPLSIDHKELLEPDEVILLVDDQQSLIVLLRDYLKKYGFVTVTAGSGRELRQAFTKHNVALVLLDIGLPDVDGRELLPEITVQYPDTSIIMMTAVTDLQTALECMRCGADDYLTKPVEFTALRETICRILEKRRLMINNCRYQQQLETMTRELEKNKDLLIEAERYSALGHMASQLAHRIRNPITSIGGTARLLFRKIDDPALQKFLSVMIRDAERVENTLEKLFDFVEQKVPETEPVGLYALINKSLLLYFTGMRKLGIDHELILPDEEPVVEVDPDLIGQVFVHLIRNAVEAMSEGGKLVIEVAVLEKGVQIAVRDSGNSLGMSGLYRATDPFYTTKASGDGIGLALVKRIVEDHNGVFELKQCDGGGVEARILLKKRSM